MTQELTASERRFTAIVERIASLCQAATVQNLQKYHQIGQLTQEFMDGLAENRYGGATMDRLANELHERGVLTDVEDRTRWLRWAKAVYNMWPDFEALETLSTMGFTASHAKRIISMHDGVRDTVMAQMIVDGRMVSTRDLDELVKAAMKEYQLDRACDAMTEAIEEKKAAAADTEVVDAIPDDEGQGGGGGGQGEAPLQVTPEPETRPEPPDTLINVANPSKVVSSVERSMYKIVAEIPDAFIAIRQSQRDNFGSDKDYQKFQEKLTSLLEAGRQALPAFQELLATIEAACDAGSSAAAEG